MTCEEYHLRQAEFAAMVREAVKAGRHVVLLSSGDPTIYGPDMWTVKELMDLGPTIIPGLSAFNAANAALQVALGEVMLTAPFKKEGSRDSIEQLAGHDRATMVIFMPRDMDELFARLSKSCPADTPAAIVSNAGMVSQEKITMGTMGGFAADTSGINERRSIVYVGKALDRAAFKPAPASHQTGKGKFYLVGVGPGDPDLITLRGLDVIKSADLIFAHQRLKEKFREALSGKKVITG
ncbi:MAG: SAM-dependent methyltransferase, partial [Thermodesulfobacteriota bacterium]|nr:SAM-dependent methyltransferase [Thermodesulfobacteriota bacterium]